MTCQEIFAALSQYLDRELPDASCEELDRHIAGCDPCVEFVDSLRQSIALCKDFVPERAPEPLSEEVRERMRSAYAAMLSRKKL